MRPPRVARWLLERALPAQDRAVMLGDLAEEFELRRKSGSGASWWYWRQTLAALPQGVSRRLPRPETMLADIRFTLRLWRRHPAFAGATILTQAVGIAVMTAVLVVAYAILIKPLPYQDPQRLVRLLEGTRSGQFSFQDFVDVRRANRALAGVAAHSGGTRTLTRTGSVPERVPMAEVTDGFFEVLGVIPAGRTFTAADVHRGAPPVVILSHQSWMTRFGGDSAAVGKSLILNGQPHEVVGILPQSFSFPPSGRPELWLPMRPTIQQEQRGYMHWMNCIARVRADLTEAQVRADLESISQLIAERDRTNHANVTLRSIPLHEMMVAPVRPTINALLAGIVLVVLVTCATTAAILLSRTAERRRELSVRSAVGASRSRIVSQLLTENLLLSLTGGGLGIVAGHWLVSSFVASMPAQQKAVLPNFDNPGVGLVVAAIAMTISVATALLFGVIPAIHAVRVEGSTTFRSGRTTAGTADMRVRSALVALQVAFALILLAGAGLIGASVQRLLNVPYTFDPAGLITMRMNLPPKYDGTDAIRSFQDQLLNELHATPGIQSAGFINQAPLMGGGNNGDLHISGRPAEPAGHRPVVVIRTVSSGYFSSMRVPLLRGRSFGATDTMAAPQVVVINRVLADSVFAGTEPVGQHISFQFLPGQWQIVGIVDNERFDDIDRPLLPAVYFTADQQPTGSFVLVVRSSDTTAAVAATRRVVSRMDPDLPIFAIRTLDDIAAASSGVFLRRATLWMLSIFAGASLLLAAMGLYGVLAQSVTDRTREIGVRVALGASRGSIVRLVMNRAFLSAGTGAIIGVAGTLLASKWLSSLVFGISPRDPLTIAMATTFLGIVTLIACLVPTIRALQIDPATAVRE